MFLSLGDHPEIQSESGNSQGGHYPCNCGCKVSQFSNLYAVYSRKLDSLEKRRTILRFCKYPISLNSLLFVINDIFYKPNSDVSMRALIENMMALIKQLKIFKKYF